MSRDQHRPNSLRVGDSLVVAASVGLLTGLVEGIGLLILQKTRWAGLIGNVFFVSPPILYVSPLVDFFLFAVAALALAVLFRIARRPVPTSLLFSLPIFLMLFDWLTLLLS